MRQLQNKATNIKQAKATFNENLRKTTKASCDLMKKSKSKKNIKPRRHVHHPYSSWDAEYLQSGMTLEKLKVDPNLPVGWFG